MHVSGFSSPRFGVMTPYGQRLVELAKLPPRQLVSEIQRMHDALPAAGQDGEALKALDEAILLALEKLALLAARHPQMVLGMVKQIENLPNHTVSDETALKIARIYAVQTVV